MKPLRTVAIVGVGLIGGSIGLALRERKLAERVIGIGRRQESLRIARRVGAVTNTTVDLDKGVAEADLVIEAAPGTEVVVALVAASTPWAKRRAWRHVRSIRSASLGRVDSMKIPFPFRRRSCYRCHGARIG